MNRSSLRFARNSLPPLDDLARWLHHQDGNHVLGLSLSAPSEDTLQAENRDPLAVPSLHRVEPPLQMVRSFTAHQFFVRVVDQLRRDPALAFNAQARPIFIELMQLLHTRPMTDGLLVHELRTCLQSLARLKVPLVEPVYEALCQALNSLDHDYSLETIARFTTLARTLDEVLLGQASAQSLAHIDADLLDEFQLLPGVWPVFKQRYEQLALQ